MHNTLIKAPAYYKTNEIFIGRIERGDALYKGS